METKIIAGLLIAGASFFIGRANGTNTTKTRETVYLTKEVTNLQMGDLDEYHESDFLLYNHPDKAVYFNNVGTADTMYIYNIID